MKRRHARGRVVHTAALDARAAVEAGAEAPPPADIAGLLRREGIRPKPATIRQYQATYRAQARTSAREQRARGRARR